jgi:hypothetical protein
MRTTCGATRARPGRCFSEKDDSIDRISNDYSKGGESKGGENECQFVNSTDYRGNAKEGCPENLPAAAIKCVLCPIKSIDIRLFLGLSRRKHGCKYIFFAVSQRKFPARVGLAGERIPFKKVQNLGAHAPYLQSILSASPALQVQNYQLSK